MKNNLEHLKNTVYLSFGEEVGNAVSHGVMAVLLLLLQPWVAVNAYLRGGWMMVFGKSVFIVSMFLMFLASTLYHTMAYDTRHKLVFRLLDHIFIYVAIAGSYTPIALNVVGGILGWVIFGIQWAMVLFGILYKSLSKKSVPKVSLVIYLVMGWIAVLFIPSIIRHTGWGFMALILGGGIFYSIGSWFYRRQKPFDHFIWHLFIDAASICHFIAIIWFI